MLHKHLTPEQRNELSALLRAKVKKKDIARCLGKDRATIWRELQRNGSENSKYYARKAKRLTKERRINANSRFRKIESNQWLRKHIIKKLKKLIDGGPTPVILEKLAQEMPFWDRTIDLIILTHPEHDHLAGLLEVLRRYKIDYILWTGIVRDTNEYREWKRLIEGEKAEIKIAKAGQKVKLGENAHFEILYPVENLEGQEFKNSNNTSIISLLVFNQDSFLFTGDAYKSVERKIIEINPNLNADILKVGHHGSKTSSSEEFIEQILPEAAVISVGKSSRYGHPHQETLETLKKYGIRVLRTDFNGDIKIISDEIRLKIK